MVERMRQQGRKVNTIVLMAAGFLMLAVACSPSVAPPSDAAVPDSGGVQPAQVIPEGCRTFAATPFGDEATDQYVLYRDQMAIGDLEAALPLWRYVYEKAPDADGQRNTVYTDGVKIFSHLYREAQTEKERLALLDTVMAIYDASLSCYGKTPTDRAMVRGMKAFDAYYTFSDLVSGEQTYQLFASAFDSLGTAVPAFVFNPFTALLVDRFQAGEVELQEARTRAALLPALLEEKKGKLSDRQWREEGWDIVEGYVPSRLEALEGEEGFYDCRYYQEKYLPDYRAQPDDCEVMKLVYGRLRWGNCDPKAPVLMEIWQKMIQMECIEIQQGTSASAEGKQCLQEGDYTCAVEKFEIAANETEDPDKKAQYFQLIAKIYYSGLKRYSQARSFAYKAAEYKPDWGEPWLLIGKLYASSGPLCGPGRGWDSQIVTWPAIDKWKYARSIDSEVRQEANKLISYYEQFMPTREDIFQRTLKEGDSFRVGCWIQEQTIIRAAPQ